jgi:hypothetical protein
LAGKLVASVVFGDEHRTTFMDIRLMNIRLMNIRLMNLGPRARGPGRPAASLNNLAEVAGARVFEVGPRVAAAL